MSELSVFLLEIYIEEKGNYISNCWIEIRTKFKIVGTYKGGRP